MPSVSIRAWKRSAGSITRAARAALNCPHYEPVLIFDINYLGADSIVRALATIGGAFHQRVHVALERGIAGAIHLAHTARADGREDPGRAEFGAGGNGHGNNDSTPRSTSSKSTASSTPRSSRSASSAGLEPASQNGHPGSLEAFFLRLRSNRANCSLLSIHTL